MKLSQEGIPSIASLFSAYASLSAFITLLQQAYKEFIPEKVRNYIHEKIEQWFNKPVSSPSSFTLVIEQVDDMEKYNNHNQIFEACEQYLCSKLSESATRLKVTRQRASDNPIYRLASGEQFREVFEGVEIMWSYIINGDKSEDEKRYFELNFEKKNKDKVLNSYLPFVLKLYDKMTEKEKELKLYTLGSYCDWRSVDFKHPFTFDSLAMDPEIKKSITDDLDRFIKRKEFYKKVGKAWKRGYLLYGPPGTGKSSIIAAMANYLNFDIYDLQLDQVKDDSELRNLMLWIENKSILVVEDIDCSSGLPSRRKYMDSSTSDGSSSDDGSGSDDSSSSDDDNNGDQHLMISDSKISLSALLNFLDGIWSSCGEERIIIFTTNHKERLDPALLRAGRMDVHIHMSYLTMPGFRILASNYLDISTDDNHPLFEEIDGLIQTVNVTAAQVAEEMLRSDDADTALQGVVELLQKKKSEEGKIRKGGVLSKKKGIKEVGEQENVGKIEN